MAKRAITADAELYEKDYYAWVQRQLELLRTRRFEDVDLDNLIEEVEDLGKSERNAVLSHTHQLVRHLLKLQVSPASQPRHGWRKEVRNHRIELRRHLSPTLRRLLQASLAAVYEEARGSAALDLEEDRVGEQALPSSCPYTLDQILDLDWLPDNVHGLRDPTE